MSFLDDYEPVEARIEKFWEDNPGGRILTELLPSEPGTFIVKAYIYRGPNPRPVVLAAGEELIHLPVDYSSPYATGLAQETIGDSQVNKTSALENCETSAIGRALANLGYAAKGKRPSREEMVKTREPSRPPHALWLADAVQVFKGWDEDQRRDAYTEAMRYLGFEELDTQVKAEAVFKNMTAAYEERPMEQAELLVEETAK